MRCTSLRAQGGWLLMAGATMLGLASCASGGRAPDAGLTAAEQYAAERAGDRPNRDRPDRAMAAGSELVGFDAFRDRLAEFGGGIVAEELILDFTLEDEAARRGITITQPDLDRERQLVLETIAAELGESSTSRSTREQLLERVRAGRGLGPVRFEALLRRNATLRALVADQVSIDDIEIEAAYALRYGPRSSVRLITVDTAGEAQQIIAVLKAGESFADLAARRSTDSSAARGGYIGLINHADPSYPLAVREAIAELGAGGVSEAIALDRGYAVVRVDSTDFGSRPSLGTVRDEIERDARRREERVLMDALARRLTAGIEPRFFDPSIGWSWRARRSGVREQ